MNCSARTLVVAPYVGEFGWELMNWQARVRWVVSHDHYQRVIVGAEADRRTLYAQPNTAGRVVFCPIPPLKVPGHGNEDHRLDDRGRPVPPGDLRRIVESQMGETCGRLGIRLDGVSVLAPDYNSTIWPTEPPHQDFVSFRIRQPVAVDIVLVPRLRRLACERNQPESWWNELAGRLRDRGLSVETYQPRLDDAIRQLSRARLAIGASTGGLHLASLCECPHYVWGSGAEARWTRLGITNRQRYETIWNPLGTPCRYDECGWRPPMAHVLDRAREALDEIGLASGATAPGWSLKPTWRVKRGLARLLKPDGAESVWPWRVRHLVREHIV
ncbi:MAG TPA: hypothetical protein VMV94_09215 [Phycisphaerae bacterium]|nr:hypothetical protein [Phycisphaerae bacterium]